MPETRLGWPRGVSDRAGHADRGVLPARFVALRLPAAGDQRGTRSPTDARMAKDPAPSSLGQRRSRGLLALRGPVRNEQTLWYACFLFLCSCRTHPTGWGALSLFDPAHVPPVARDEQL